MVQVTVALLLSYANLLGVPKSNDLLFIHVSNMNKISDALAIHTRKTSFKNVAVHLLYLK